MRHTHTHPLPFFLKAIVECVREKMNLFIHSVTVLSVSVYVGVSRNSESFYTAFLTVHLNLEERKLLWRFTCLSVRTKLEPI